MKEVFGSESCSFTPFEELLGLNSLLLFVFFVSFCSLFFVRCCLLFVVCCCSLLFVVVCCCLLFVVWLFERSKGPSTQRRQKREWNGMQSGVEWSGVCCAVS